MGNNKDMSQNKKIIRLKERHLVYLPILYSVKETSPYSNKLQSFTKDLMDSLSYNEKLSYGDIFKHIATGDKSFIISYQLNIGNAFG